MRIRSLSLSLLSLLGCSQPQPARSTEGLPSILLISIDTLRADHLGSYGYAPYSDPVSPAIDELAEGGAVFTNCFAPRGQTVPSLCSMMVGKYPSAHGVRENGQRFAEGQTTLAERLGEIGYETYAFVSRLPAKMTGHPARGVHVLEGGKDHPDGTPAADMNESDAIVADRALEWLDGVQPGGSEPFFAWVHFYAVHKPYAPPPPYDTMFTGDYAGPFKPQPGEPAHALKRVVKHLDAATLANEPLDESDHQYILALYDGGIRATDEHVKRILAKLRERGLEQDTLVILTSDHGEELGDHHNYYFHGNSVYDGTLEIPMILRWPGRIEAGRRVDELISNVDLVPTILEWVGEEAPSELEGVSLVPWLAGTPPAHPPREHVFVEWQDMIYGVRTRDHKYLINPDGVHPKKPPYYGQGGSGFPIECEELYVLPRDPREQVNRHEEFPEKAKELRRLTLEFRSRPATIRGWRASEEEALDNLRELGYVGSLPGRDDLIFGAEDCESGKQK